MRTKYGQMPFTHTESHQVYVSTHLCTSVMRVYIMSYRLQIYNLLSKKYVKIILFSPLQSHIKLKIFKQIHSDALQCC